MPCPHPGETLQVITLHFPTNSYCTVSTVKVKSAKVKSYKVLLGCNTVVVCHVCIYNHRDSINGLHTPSATCQPTPLTNLVPHSYLSQHARSPIGYSIVY